MALFLPFFLRTPYQCSYCATKVHGETISYADQAQVGVVCHLYICVLLDCHSYLLTVHKQMPSFKAKCSPICECKQQFFRN